MNSFDPFVSVGLGLKHLAQRLDPLISDALKPHLGGLAWPAVLTELDRAKGRTPKTWAATDLQSQLRMLTERLGGLGYPFDDHTRHVSVLGSELRIMRNRFAHDGVSLTNLDAWRANDFAVRLLEHFKDEVGVKGGVALRDEALVALAAEQGLAGAPVPLAKRGAPAAAEPTSDTEVVAPDPEVMTRINAAATPTIGNGRWAFESWTTVAVGDVSVLDELPKKLAKEKVRAVATEIAEFEGPIHMDRLAQLTAAAFGVQRLFPRRAKKLIYQIRQCGLTVDGDKFVWPNDLVPDTWEEFRPNSSDVDRPFVQVSPREVANAMRAVSKPGMTTDEVDTATLQTFGRKRKTKQFADHLARARDLL